MAEGRRRKFRDQDRVIGRDEGPASFRARAGCVVRYMDGSQYEVQFDDGRTEVVMSSWIERER